MYDAFATDADRRVRLARKARKLSPDCADAYVVLAEEVIDPGEARAHYQHGIEVAGQALGSAFLNEHVGDFFYTWRLVRTCGRYMGWVLRVRRFESLRRGLATTARR